MPLTAKLPFLMEVLKNPDPKLREKSLPVAEAEFGSFEMKALVQELKDTMTLENGVGIAAPQVGVHKRVIIVDSGSGAQAFFNPVIKRRSLRKVESEEGCLSVPGVFGIVRRHRSVIIEAVNEEGEPITIHVSQFPAIVFQHEIDHLDGVLFIDKVIRYTAHPRI